MVTKYGLKEFLHRQEVLKFYRSVLRDVKRLPIEQRPEILSYVKHEFRTGAAELGGNKYILFTGRQHYSQMKRSMGL